MLSIINIQYYYTHIYVDNYIKHIPNGYQYVYIINKLSILSIYI